MLPIVQRELSVAARSPVILRNRLLAGFAQVTLALGLIVFSNPGGRTPPGSGMFRFMAALALLFCLIEGLRKAADCISEEKREGTLGFLFLTELRGFDIVLGKFAGAAIRSFSGLLAFIPVMAVTLLLGGVTAGEFWRVVLALLVALFLSLSVGVCVSTFTRDRSIVITLAVLGVLCVLPPLAGPAVTLAASNPAGGLITNISPLGSFSTASDLNYSNARLHYWGGILVQFSFSSVALIAASAALPRIWQRSTAKTTSERVQAQRRVEPAIRQRLLDVNPILWVAYDSQQKRLFHIIFVTALIVYPVLALGVGSIAGIPVLVILVLVFHVFVASQSSVTLAESKRNGALELLLSTPLKVVDILDGQWAALRRMFLVPALVLTAVVGFAAWDWGNDYRPFDFSYYLKFKFVLEVPLGLLATAYTGIWFGLKSRSPNRAFFNTLVLAVILPQIVCLPTLLLQLLVLSYARQRSKDQFRRIIAEKYLQQPGFILSSPSVAERSSPPVIR